METMERKEPIPKSQKNGIRFLKTCTPPAKLNRLSDSGSYRQMGGTTQYP
jgi:hypothetical protein